jgi:ATP-dependent DNA helicase RecG
MLADFDMDAETIKKLIAGGESATLELKINAPRPSELSERLCGLSNARGGLVILGVEDKTLRIMGVRDISLSIDVALRAARMCNPPLTLNPPEPQVVEVEGATLIVIGVPAAGGKLHQAGGVFWTRRGTYTVPLSLHEIVEAVNDRTTMFEWEVQAVRRATIADLNPELIENYLSHRPTRIKNSSRYSRLEEILLALNCATELEENNQSFLRPTNAGMLLFGYEPQQFILQSDIVCTLYKDELGIGKYIDRKILRGPLTELIVGAAQFFEKHVPVSGEVVKFQRVDQPLYSLECLREAVVNAIVHRDYSRSGESIRIFYYSNRIEIHNPGLLLPPLTVEQLAHGQVTSKLRNPVIANLLRDIPGYMERVGSGIKFMLAETRRIGQPAPIFKEVNEFVVTFPQFASIESESDISLEPAALIAPVFETIQSDLVPIATEPANANTASLQNVNTNFDLEMFGVNKLQSRLTLVMRYIHEHGSITNKEYRDLTGASSSTALRDLEALVKHGALKGMGQNRGRRYFLP